MDGREEGQIVRANAHSQLRTQALEHDYNVLNAKTREERPEREVGHGKLVRRGSRHGHLEVVRHHVTYVCTATWGERNLLEEVDDVSLYGNGGAGQTDVIDAAEEGCSDVM